MYLVGGTEVDDGNPGRAETVAEVEIHPSDEVLGHTGVELTPGPLDDLNQLWLAKIGVHLGIRPLLDAGDELKDDVG